MEKLSHWNFALHMYMKCKYFIIVPKANFQWAITCYQFVKIAIDTVQSFKSPNVLEIIFIILWIDLEVIN